MKKILSLILVLFPLLIFAQRPLTISPQNKVSPGVSLSFPAPINIEQRSTTDVQDHGNMGSSQNFDATYDSHLAIIDSDCTVTFSNWPILGKEGSINITFLNVGGFSLTWPGTVVKVPQINLTPNSITQVTLTTKNGGLTVLANSDYAGDVNVRSITTTDPEPFKLINGNQITITLARQSGSASVNIPDIGFQVRSQLGGNDEFTLNNHSQLLYNKTIDNPNIIGGLFTNSVGFNLLSNNIDPNQTINAFNFAKTINIGRNASTILNFGGTPGAEWHFLEPGQNGNPPNFYTGFKTQVQDQNLLYTFPATQGLVNQTLVNDGTGILSWKTLPLVSPSIVTFTGFDHAITLTLANSNFIVAGANVANTFSSPQIFNNNVTIGTNNGVTINTTGTGDIKFIGNFGTQEDFNLRLDTANTWRMYSNTGVDKLDLGVIGVKSTGNNEVGAFTDPDGVHPLNNIVQKVSLGIPPNVTSIAPTYTAVAFSIDSPIVTLPNIGTYIISANIQTSLQAARVPDGVGVLFKLHRIVPSQLDLAGSTFGTSLPTEGSTTTRLGPTVNIVSILYTSTQTNEQITVYGALDAAITLGNIRIDTCTITAVRLY